MSNLSEAQQEVEKEFEEVVDLHVAHFRVIYGEVLGFKVTQTMLDDYRALMMRNHHRVSDVGPDGDSMWTIGPKDAAKANRELEELLVKYNLK